MSSVPDSPLVSTEWLAAHLDAPDLRIVDGSWYLPSAQRDPREEYRLGHIPGAVFFDIDDISYTSISYPLMLTSPEQFSSRVRALGIRAGVRVVDYACSGLFSAPCVGLLFR